MMKLMTVTALLLGSTVAATATRVAPEKRGTEPEIKWGPAPAVFPAGAQMAVMQGDPSGKALFTVRLRLPNGYKLPPHTHPTDENVTVVSGTFLVGMGKTFDASQMLTLNAGGFAVAPANEPHYALARGLTVVQVHAIGPFALTYVNPADAPKTPVRR